MSDHHKVRSEAGVTGPAPIAGPARPSEAYSWTTLLVWAGLVLLYLAACAWGVLEVHYSTDTWIGLAAGRQIMTEPTFPKTDTFSYTFYGQPWFNQNWLSHVFFWLLYSKLGPTALVLGTWAVSLGTFTFVLGATWFRCHSWPAAFLAAACVAITSRDWLSIRPATIQFFLLAAAWLAFSALLSRRERPRWRPIFLLLLIYGVWPHAHGSFLFGFGLLGLFLGCAAVVALLGRKFAVRPAIGLRPGVALIAVTLVTAILGVALSPYGLENMTHPFKVVESEVFRTVGEWYPPYRIGLFPSVTRFWAFVAVAGISPLVLLLLRLADAPRPEPLACEGRTLSSGAQRRPRRRGQAPAGPARSSPPAVVVSFDLNAVLFDLASVALGFGMAMFARRFAPIFYILATPAIVAWLMTLVRSLSAPVRRAGWIAMIVGVWLGAIASIAVTWYYAYSELVAPKDVLDIRRYGLLDRVTSNYRTPLRSMEFLSRNGLTPNVMTEWKIAAAVMFHVPGARVFIDGRAQQVYDEQCYLTYNRLIGQPEPPAEFVADVLDRSRTDLVLLPRWNTLSGWKNVMNRQSQWTTIIDEPEETLWIRRSSHLFEDLVRRERDGTLWKLDQPAAMPGGTNFRP